jgi:hypothetical protein
MGQLRGFERGRSRTEELALLRERGLVLQRRAVLHERLGLQAKEDGAVCWASRVSPCFTPEAPCSTTVEGKIVSEVDKGGVRNDAGDADTVGRYDVPVEARSFMLKVPILGSSPPSLATPSA